MRPRRRARSSFSPLIWWLALGAALVGRFFGEERFRIPLAWISWCWRCSFTSRRRFRRSGSCSLFAVFALATRGNERAMLALVAAGDGGDHRRVWQWKTRFAGRASGTGLQSASGRLFPGWAWDFSARARASILPGSSSSRRSPGCCNSTAGLTESIRQALGEMALAFECEQACLAVRDEELERLFVWKVRPDDREPGSSGDTCRSARSETFLVR